MTFRADRTGGHQVTPIDPADPGILDPIASEAVRGDDRIVAMNGYTLRAIGRQFDGKEPRQRGQCPHQVSEYPQSHCRNWPRRAFVSFADRARFDHHLAEISSIHVASPKSTLRFFR
jgi:hypothetical protein